MEAIAKIPFQLIDWSAVNKIMHPGTAGTAWWQTLQLPGLRIRVVEYTSGYLADHWCSKGHLVYCISGSFESELETGGVFIMTQGMGYIVSDDMSTHRSSTNEGVQLLIIDGDFLK